MSESTPAPDAAQRSVAVFDSGVGGLTVMRAIVDALPHEHIVYLGDTARVPYGNRGADTVQRYALNAAHLLHAQHIKALVVACNTATAFALPALQARYPDIPVIGVVEPVAALAAAHSQTGHIGVIGTRGTVRSEAYMRALGRLWRERQLPQRPSPLDKASHEVCVHQLACPLLVPLAEEGWLEGPLVEEIVARYLEPLAHGEVDTLILGCTHYPLLRSAIEAVLARSMPRPVTLLDSGHATAQALAHQLGQRQWLRQGPEPGHLRFLLTDLPEGFEPTAQRFFQAHIANCEHVDILDQQSSGALDQTTVHA